MKKIRNLLLATVLFAGAASLPGCHEPDSAIDELELDRVLSPLAFSLTMEANVNATFTWTAMTASKEYLLELFREDGTSYERRELTYDPATSESTTMSAEFLELPASSNFTARLWALSSNDRVADSKPVELSVKTGIENLFLEDGVVADADVTATSAVMRWKAGSAVTHLDVDNGVGRLALDETAVADGVYTLTGLTTGTTYVVRLYNEAKDAYRGSCTFVASDKIDVAVNDKTSAAITIGWGAEVTLTSVGICPEGVEGAQTTMTDLSAGDIAARSFTFTGLEALSEYRISVYDAGVECGALYVTTLGEVTAWDFTAWDLVTYGEDTTVDGLTILAASGKEVYISADADFGVNYLDLKGKSTITSGYTSAPTQRALKFGVDGEGVVVIDCYANGAGRNFYAFVDALGKSFGPIEAPVKADRGKIYIPCPGIAGAANVYIFTDASINHIYAMQWYKGAEAPGQHAEKLATPVGQCDPSEITKGDATAVRFSWEAVANAATYDYKLTVTKIVDGVEEPETFSGNISATEYMLAADVAAQLKPGTYTLTVNARPASEYKYAPSSAGSIVLTVNDTKLSTPDVKLEPAKVTVGTATAVTASWKAVEGAASYEVSFNNASAETVGTPSYTIEAAAVAALAVGKYTISVVAKPAETSAQSSDAGTAELTVAEASGPGGDNFMWNFSDSGFDAFYAQIGEANNDAFNEVWNGLSITCGGKSIKCGTSSGLRYIQTGGAGSATQRCFSFEASASGKLTVVASNTGSSEDLNRMVTVAVDGAVVGSLAGGYASTTPTACEFDLTVTAGSIVTIYPAGNGLRFYSIEYVSGGGSGGETGTEYTMTLSATAGVVSSNISGLPTSWGDATWTATDDTGASTITFTGTIYSSSDAAKNVVWYFNKSKTETHVAAADMGQIRSIAIYPTSDREPDYLKCTCNSGTAVAAAEPLGAKTSVITFDFGAAGITADNFRLDYDKSWTEKPSNVEVNKVVLVYTK